MVGALIMTHSDDDGLVLPPMLAPAHRLSIAVHAGDGNVTTPLVGPSGLVACGGACPDRGQRGGTLVEHVRPPV